MFSIYNKIATPPRTVYISEFIDRFTTIKFTLVLL